MLRDRRAFIKFELGEVRLVFQNSKGSTTRLEGHMYVHTIGQPEKRRRKSISLESPGRSSEQGYHASSCKTLACTRLQRKSAETSRSITKSATSAGLMGQHGGRPPQDDAVPSAPVPGIPSPCASLCRTTPCLRYPLPGVLRPCSAGSPPPRRSATASPRPSSCRGPRRGASKRSSGTGRGS